MLGVLKQYNGDSLYLAAAAVSVGIVYYKGRKEKYSTGKKMLAAVFLAVLFVFNGVSYRLIGRLTDATTYYRFFWMLPVLFVTAYVLTEAVTAKERRFRLAGVLALCVCLAVGGNFFINSTNVSRPHNVYGLDRDTLAAADAVMADWEQSAHGKGELPAVAFDMYMEYQARTYEPRITWAVGRKAYLYQAKHGYDYVHGKYRRQQRIIAAVNEGLKEDAQALLRALNGTGTDYLVIRTEFAMDDYLAQIQVTPVFYGERYTLYKVPAARG